MESSPPPWRDRAERKTGAIMRSKKEYVLDRRLKSALKAHGDALMLFDAMLCDEELRELQDYANTVSIRRLGFNDHGPVHMREVALNAVRMLELLREAGVRTSLETDEAGDFEDSVCAVLCAAFMHDIGMTVGRQDHERVSCILAAPVIDRLLAGIESVHRRIIIKATALEGILGHMATRRVHSVEAGIILVADGCDMERGRARIPMSINKTPQAGDIHKYSANSILRVEIVKGEKKPIKIDVEMESEVGFFQIEEVLLSKVDSSTVKPYVEIYAGVNGTRREYL